MNNQLKFNSLSQRLPYCDSEACNAAENFCGGLSRVIISLKIETSNPNIRNRALFPANTLVTAITMIYSMAEQLLIKARQIKVVELEDGKREILFRGFF